MTGLLQRALGEEWEALHPQLRDRYGLVAGEDREAVGRGEMNRMTRSILALPVLWLGTTEDFLFPESGSGVPFKITTEAFLDDNDNEALFLRRHFETDPPRDFVDTLRWNPERGCITDLFGRNGRVVADLHLRVDDGALSLSLGTQWLQFRGRYLTQPGPFSVDASLRDRYDDDADVFRVSARITSPIAGQVFGYEGQFENEFQTVSADTTTTSTLGAVDLPGAKA